MITSMTSDFSSSAVNPSAAADVSADWSAEVSAADDSEGATAVHPKSDTSQTAGSLLPLLDSMRTELQGNRKMEDITFALGSLPGFLKSNAAFLLTCCDFI